MPFTTKPWQDNPTHTTPINAAGLIDLETRLSAYADASARFATNGELTLPRGHLDDSSSYSSTPASQVLHLSYFVALASRTVGHVQFGTGSVAAAGNTLTQAALFSVNLGTGALTQIGASASPGTALGSFAQANLALTAGVALTAGSSYAVGLLQIGTTSASLLGVWANNEFLGKLPALCRSVSGQSSMPSSVAAGSLAATNYIVDYFVTT